MATASPSQYVRWGWSAILALLLGTAFAETPIVKHVTLDAGQRHQTIDGFGINVTPAQWRNGNLRGALDRLVDDLGSTLIRFDCYGTADWLDPAKRNADGRYPAAYLREIYTSPVFRNAWETFRYLNTKGLEPFFNVSGRVPAEMTGIDGETLVDYDGYAEMVVSLLTWARAEERLRFSLFAPFNETNVGFPEGPALEPEGAVPAIKAVLRRMDEAGLGDVRLIVMGDGGSLEYLDPIIRDPSMLGRIACFSTHTYGNGGDQEITVRWYREESKYARALRKVRNSPYKRSPFWMTEYGDLDQSGEVEFGIAWRSTRRLLKFLGDGFSAGMAWDAFDNLHEHDAAWATYGLLHTDRTTWTYTPKRRYYAARQVYRYVLPGFQRVAIVPPPPDPADAFARWRTPLKHLRLLGFVSPDGEDFTIVGMNTIERDVDLRVALTGVAPAALRKPVFYYRTSREEDCLLIEEMPPRASAVEATVPERSIFTLTTVQRD